MINELYDEVSIGLKTMVSSLMKKRDQTEACTAAEYLRLFCKIELHNAR